MQYGKNGFLLSGVRGPDDYCLNRIGDDSPIAPGFPEKTFVAGPTDKCACNDCRFMKMNTLEKMRDALTDLSPAIEMDESLRARAYVPIKRMLDWSR